MKRSGAIVLMAVICAMALSAALAGCASGASSSAAAQKDNRAYMSQVNETMVELDASLEQFVDAVSRGDVVNMRTQADNAYKYLDKLADIKAPEELKDVREAYVSGTAKLREALDDYIALYTEMANGTGSETTSYDARISSIQAKYDEGVALLQKGDAIAAGTSASASSASSSIQQASSSASGQSASTQASASADSQSASSQSSADSQSTGSASSSAASAASSQSSDAQSSSASSMPSRAI